MKLDVSYRNIKKDLHKSTRKKIKELVERHLEPHVSAFNPSHLRLHATIEKTKNDYRTVLRLHLPPKKILVAKANNEQVTTAIAEAIEELARQAKRHYAHVSGREQWKRKKRRQRMKQLKADIPAIETATPVTESTDKAKTDTANTSVEALLPRLERYIRHELTFLRANGDLLSTYPTLEDIRDEALIQLKVNWDKLNSNDETLYQELIKTVHEIIQKEVEQTRLHENDISIEEEIPEDAIDQSEDMVEEEMFEFYHPSEVQHIEDLLPDTHADDPEKVAEAEAREASYQVMSNMPAQWRRILVLVYQEGLPVGFIAKNILSFSTEQAQVLLEKAETFMVDSLTERGHTNVTKESLPILLKPVE